MYNIIAGKEASFPCPLIEQNDYDYRNWNFISTCQLRYLVPSITVSSYVYSGLSEQSVERDAKCSLMMVHRQRFLLINFGVYGVIEIRNPL